MYKENEFPKTLWLLAYDDIIYDHLQPFYAVSQEDAERQARQWLEQRPYLKCLSLHPYPQGFRVQYESLPGEL